MDYYIEDNILIMEYTPYEDSFNIKLEKPVFKRDSIIYYEQYPLYEYLNRVDCYRLKNTFYITKNNLIDYSDDNVYRFNIGEVTNNYILLDKNVFNIENNFYISKKIEIIDKLFFAYNKISIIKSIDGITSCSTYIDDNESYNEEMYHVSFSDYCHLIESFPNTTEIKKYQSKRISIILNDYFNTGDKYTTKYDKYIEQKTKKSNKIIISNEIKLDNLNKAKYFLENVIYNEDAMTEKEIQSNIYEILSFLFPKYIYSKREVKIDGFNKHYKIPDFILIDFSGFVDVLEIKLPSAKLLSNGTNRFNYVPSKTLSNAIQQLEKYITCINRNGLKGEEKLRLDFSNIVPEKLNISSINCQGLLIIGNKKEFTNAQQNIDFEIIKRQYRNIIDIYTYDQLLSMINNSISAISKNTK